MRAIMVEVVIRLKPVIAYICQNNCAVKDPRIICGFQCLVNNALSVQFSSVQSLSRVRLFATPWTAACQASLSITNSWVHQNPCPSSRWFHPTISSSVVSFSSCPQFFSTSGSFQMSQLFASGGQSIGVSGSAASFQWAPRTDLL